MRNRFRPKPFGVAMGFSALHGSRVGFALGLACFSALEAGATDFRQVTFATPAYDNGVGSPDWSPDGSRVAVVSWIVDAFYPYEIHLSMAVVTADGGEWSGLPNQNLPGTWHGPLNMDPSWSPRGDRLVFSGNFQLWTLGLTDSVLAPLGVGGAHPAWSPDGGSIAYTGSQGLAIVPSGGGMSIPLTSGPDGSPAWSRDGNWIAFSSMRDGRSDLWIVPAGGGEPRRITDDAAVDRYPSWSPDGELLVFSSDRSGNFDLWVVRVSNGALSQVTHDPGLDSEPAWSPDGTRIAFTSERSGSGNVWLASDLRTIRVESLTWSGLKQIYR